MEHNDRTFEETVQAFMRVRAQHGNPVSVERARELVGQMVNDDSNAARHVAAFKMAVQKLMEIRELTGNPISEEDAVASVSRLVYGDDE